MAGILLGVVIFSKWAPWKLGKQAAEAGKFSWEHTTKQTLTAYNRALKLTFPNRIPLPFSIFIATNTKYCFIIIVLVLFKAIKSIITVYV